MALAAYRTESMKALTVRQPWASLIVDGHKFVENRTWPTSYRGPIAIHAGLALAPWPDIHQVATMSELGLCPPVNLQEQPRGSLLGIVQLVDVLTGYDSIWTTDTTFQWLLREPQRFVEPVPYAGKLGLWEVPDDELGPIR